MDRSDSNRHVFNAAVTLAQAIGGKLMLLHVLSAQEQGYPDASLMSKMMEDPDISREEAARIYLQQLETFKEKGTNLLRSRAQEAMTAGVATEISQTQGNPGYSICDLARTWGADLIMMGRRSDAFLAKLFLESSSNYVNHHAPCSVLVVRNQTANPTKIAVAQTDHVPF